MPKLASCTPLFLLLPLFACDRVPVCGNQRTEDPEQCDDGNAFNDDGCNSVCGLPSCGNNITDEGERCDDGNTADGDGCSSLCRDEFCGDAALQPALGEACDDGNNAPGDGCRANCTTEACGDNIVDPNETCDDGNLIDTDACTNSCALASCGDGVLSAGEQCDDDNNTNGDGCSAACIIEICGDGIVNPSEECDDGNTTDGDSCSSLCKDEFCGDAVTNNLTEECDDGNQINDDTCRNDCTLPVCGDGVVSTGEGCDDTNNEGGDGCAADCSKIELCGDGVVDAAEPCDDGNLIDNDSCSNSCVAGPLPLRVAAGNLTSGNLQSYDLGHGTRIFQALNADVVLLQEFNFGDGSASTIRGFVDSAFGAEFEFFRENGGAGNIPNGVISRFPIIEAAEENDPQVANRDFVWARIDLPNTSQDLWAISLHLLSSGSSQRSLEADALVAFIQANIPATDYLVIGGDFNTESRTESAVTKLGTVTVTAAPFPADQLGNNLTNAPRSKPFDWVLADPDLDPLQTSTVIGAFTFPDGMVFDSRLFTQSELNASFSPVLVADSGAPSMQHMAVVKDFIIPP